MTRAFETDQDGAEVTTSETLPVVAPGPEVLQGRAPAAAPTSSQRLSAREKEIAQLVAVGNGNKAVARILGISPWTVATYLRRIYSKVGVSNRTALSARLLSGKGPQTPAPIPVQMDSSR